MMNTSVLVLPSVLLAAPRKSFGARRQSAEPRDGHGRNSQC